MSWQDSVRQIAQDLSVPDQIKVEDMPKITLYMEQLLSFVNDSLSFYRRSDAEPPLTKAMINNYSKNHISPPPVDKMYRKLHIMAYALIYQFKQLISLDDMKSITSQFEHTADLEKTYRIFLGEQLQAFSNLPQTAEEIVGKAEHLETDDPKLILPVLIAQLLVRAQVEIMMVQKLIDKIGDN